MRYSTEHQRNIAFDLLQFRRSEWSVRECFAQGEPLIIYGLDFLGRELYFELKEWVNVLCFIDRSHDMEQFDRLPVYGMDNAALPPLLGSYREVKVLVVVLSDWNNIAGGIRQRFKNAAPVSVYALTAACKLHHVDFVRRIQPPALELVKKMTANEPAEIGKIVLVGTSYTQLLSFLALPDWQDALYIAEHFFPAAVAEKMTAYGIPCLYEQSAGEFYDICYLIAAYARAHDIPVYGHDHMFLARAFLENSVTVIEDGDANYAFRHAVTYQTMLDDRRVYYPFGFDRLVHKVILTGLMSVPPELTKKAVCIEPSALWSGKSEPEKRMIADLYSFPYDEILTLVEEGRDFLFLTEAYSFMNGDDVISDQKQVEMYRELLSQYDSGRILIKPHPSDHVDYGRMMPEYKILPKQFPIQMLTWTGIALKKIIVMWGTTCMHIFSDGYEVDVHKDILYRYGILT